jgi:hypothetical protein
MRPRPIWNRLGIGRARRERCKCPVREVREVKSACPCARSVSHAPPTREPCVSAVLASAPWWVACRNGLPGRSAAA